MDRQLALAGGGSLTVGEDGPRVRLEAVRPNDGKGLYKVWLWGLSGRMLLGTMAPEGEVLRLSRVISRTSLEGQGCWPPTGAEAVMAFSFVRRAAAGGHGWSWEEDPARLLHDPVLVNSARAWGGMWRRTEGEDFLLAAPWRGDGEFPMIALFCLARVEEVEGRRCAVWRFRCDGTPILPHKDPTR